MASCCRIRFGCVLGLSHQHPGLRGFHTVCLVGILTGGLSYVTTAVMTLFINSRHAFYGLTFIERFKEMRKTYPYMVFSLTDETYSLLCSMARPSDFTDREWKAATFFTSFLISATG